MENEVEKKRIGAAFDAKSTYSIRGEAADTREEVNGLTSDHQRRRDGKWRNDTLV